MNSDLTNDQNQTTSADNGQPATDPAAAKEAVRLRREAQGELAWAAFQRDFADLAREHYGQWVSYQGGQQLAVGRTQRELYQDCFRRGLQRGEFYVFGIEHPLPDNIMVNWPIVDRPSGSAGGGT